LVCGETAYQKSFKEGTLLLEAIQDVYLSEDVGIA
jgi:DhnA family fructose-bisphosphate aldolase class Ia